MSRVQIYSLAQLREAGVPVGVDRFVSLTDFRELLNRKFASTNDAALWAKYQAALTRIAVLQSTISIVQDSLKEAEQASTAPTTGVTPWQPT